MNQAIANIIKGHIEDLDFVEKIAGLVAPLTFEIKDKDNNMVQKTVPIACCVTADDCKEGAYNDLMPNSDYQTVIYFEDAGVTFERTEGNWKYFTSNLRLVCWININKILNTSCKSQSPCIYAAHIITEIMRALPEFPENNHAPIEKVFTEIVSQEIRTPSIFGAYTYDEKHSQYLMSPYDYFALNLKTTFAICLRSTSVPDSTCT
jgi:hypothetical protein